MEKSLSIVIVNWNTRDLLADCLTSVYGKTQDLTLEIFVVDNNSSDNSAAMVKEKFPQVKLMANEKNEGFAKANNKAIQQAGGNYIALLNPDTVLQNNAFKIMVDFLEENRETAAVGPKVLNQDGTLQNGCRRTIPTLRNSFYKFLGLNRLFPSHKAFAEYNLTYLDENNTCQVEAVSGCCMVVRKEAIDKAGLLDEDFFIYGEDLDWCYRLGKTGKIYYVHQAEIIHYYGEASKQRKIGAIINFYQAMSIFYRKHQAQSNFFLVNWLVYSGISLMAGIAVAKAVLLNFLKKQ